MNCQSSKDLSTKGQIEQSKESTIIHSNKGNITELNMKISNTDGCFALRNSLCFWISKKQECDSLYTVGARGREIRESFSELVLKRHDVEKDVMTFHSEDLSSFRYLIQHGQNKDIGSCNHLTKNLIKGEKDTLENVDNNE